MACIHFTNHREAQDAIPPRTPSDSRMFIHSVDHELVRRVIAIKRGKAEKFFESSPTNQGGAASVASPGKGGQ